MDSIMKDSGREIWKKEKEIKSIKMDKGTQVSGEIAKDRVKGFFPSMDRY